MTELKNTLKRNGLMHFWNYLQGISTGTWRTYGLRDSSTIPPEVLKEEKRRIFNHILNIAPNNILHTYPTKTGWYLFVEQSAEYATGLSNLSNVDGGRFRADANAFMERIDWEEYVGRDKFGNPLFTHSMILVYYNAETNKCVLLNPYLTTSDATHHRDNFFINPSLESEILFLWENIGIPTNEYYLRYGSLHVKSPSYTEEVESVYYIFPIGKNLNNDFHTLNFPGGV